MRNFNNTDGIIFGLFLLSGIPGGIFITLSSLNDKDPNSKFNDTYFYIGLSLAIISAICAGIFLIRTGIDLNAPTITNTNIRGVQQISPGFNLY